jgi:hypothetical protein
MSKQDIDFNLVINYLSSIELNKELDKDIILHIAQDIPEGIEHGYLVIRLQLLGYKFKVVKDLNALVWKLIDRGLLELTVDRKIKFIKQKEN